MRVLPTPRGSIALSLRDNDKRVFKHVKGYWVCRVTIKVPGQSAGKLKSFYFKKEWQAYAELLRHDPTAGRWVIDDNNMSIGDWLKRWLSDGRKATGAPWRPKTIESNTLLVNYYSRPLHGVALADLTEDDVRAWLESLASKTGRALTPTTRHDIHITFDAALNAAVRQKKLERNPIKGVHLTELSPPKRLTENVTWSPAEVARFVAGIKGDRHETLYLVALALGLRQGEALGLTWDDVDLDAERVHVRHQLQRNGHWQLVATKTQNSLRSVELTGNPALPALRAHLKTWKPGKIVGLERLVFLSSTGTPLDGHHLAQSFKKTIVKLGLRPIVFHELRAIFVTRNLDAGVPSNQVADMIGDTLAMVETYRRRRVEGQRVAHKAVWG